MTEQARSTIDQTEVDRFSAMAAEWWDPKGKFRPLHKFNPVRLTYIRDRVCGELRPRAKAPQPLKGLRVLDIGCGGGLLSEPMARMGAEVVGADASEKNIVIARTHAERAASRSITAPHGGGARRGRRDLRCRAQHGSGRACRRCRNSS